jgi:hypothetical protein
VKNPDSNHLRIVLKYDRALRTDYSTMLCHLAIAESNLVKAGKNSALPHFIAVVKELERIHGFYFEQIPDETE